MNARALLLAGAAAVVGGVVFATTSEANAARSDDGGDTWYGVGDGYDIFEAFAPMEDTPMAALTGRAAQLPAHERARIVVIAEDMGIDPAALAALRLAENGGPGREFGVLSVSAPTYDEQATIAARSIKNHEARYRRATGELPRGADGRYTEAFLAHFSARYAPIGAGNDPTGLNSHHARNLIAGYRASGVTA